MDVKGRVIDIIRIKQISENHKIQLPLVYQPTQTAETEIALYRNVKCYVNYYKNIKNLGQKSYDDY